MTKQNTTICKSLKNTQIWNFFGKLIKIVPCCILFVILSLGFFIMENPKQLTIWDQEIWKDIPGYEGYYQIYNFGKIKSLNRTIIHSNGHKYIYKSKILSRLKNTCGYLHIVLCKNGKKYKNVHRLVAETFISNPNNLKEINHKDGNKENNHYKNLEWITHKENLIHAVKILGIKFCENEKPVIGINTKTGQKIYFKSMREAGRNGFITESISMCCNKKKNYNTHYGYVWQFDL